MSVMDLKKELVALSSTEQAELSAFLFQLRRKDDTEYQATLRRRLDDKDPAHWLIKVKGSVPRNEKFFRAELLPQFSSALH